MIKVIGCGKRKAGLAPEEFREHYLASHSGIVAGSPGLKRYVQNVPVLSSYENGKEPLFDAVGEAWFEDWQAYTSYLQSDARTATAADEALLVDPASQRFLIVEEFEVDVSP